MESICQGPDVLEIQWPFPIEYLRNSRFPSKGPYQVLLFETILFPITQRQDQYLERLAGRDHFLHHCPHHLTLLMSKVVLG